MHPLFPPFPLLSWRRMSARSTVSLPAPLGASASVMSKEITPFIFFTSSFQWPIDLLFFSFFSFFSPFGISQEYVHQTVSRADNKPDHLWVEFCLLEFFIEKSWRDRVRDQESPQAGPRPEFTQLGLSEEDSAPSAGYMPAAQAAWSIATPLHRVEPQESRFQV